MIALRNTRAVQTLPGGKLRLWIGIDPCYILTSDLEGKHFIFAYGTKMRKIEFKFLL